MKLHAVTLESWRNAGLLLLNWQLLLGLLLSLGSRRRRLLLFPGKSELVVLASDVELAKGAATAAAERKNKTIRTSFFQESCLYFLFGIFCQTMATIPE